jgi:protein gp37
VGKTKIEWAHVTENFVSGCTEDGPECDNCYARLMSARLATMKNKPARYDGVTTGNGAAAAWTGKINVDVEAMRSAFERLAHRRDPARVFLGSMTDLFHAKVPRDLLLELFDLIAEHRRHAWLLLTKRPRRMRRIAAMWLRLRHRDALPPNLWCGVTAGDQAGADRRIPELMKIPAVRFVSIEPLLGPVVIRRQWRGLGHAHAGQADDPAVCCCGRHRSYHARVDWVIVGGESGARARPMNPAWVRSLRDQCAAAGVALHLKQWGEWHDCKRPASGLWSPQPADAPPGAVHQFDDGTVVYRVTKKNAGRVLDGRTHDELPAAWPPPVSP